MRDYSILRPFIIEKIQLEERKRTRMGFEYVDNGECILPAPIRFSCHFVIKCFMSLNFPMSASARCINLS